MLELGQAAKSEIAKLVHEEELRFQIRNKRNKQLGLWLAAELQLTEDALDYAKAIVAFGIADPDDEVLIRHLYDDLSRRGVQIPEAAIRSSSSARQSGGARMHYSAIFDFGRSLAVRVTAYRSRPDIYYTHLCFAGGDFAHARDRL